MPNTWIDGGGVYADHPLPDDARVVFRTGESGTTDITAYIQRGELILKGQYGVLVASSQDANTVTVRTLPPFYGSTRLEEDNDG